MGQGGEEEFLPSTSIQACCFAETLTSLPRLWCEILATRPREIMTHGHHNNAVADVLIGAAIGAAAGTISIQGSMGRDRSLYPWSSGGPFVVVVVPG